MIAVSKVRVRTSIFFNYIYKLDCVGMYNETIVTDWCVDIII